MNNERRKLIAEAIDYVEQAKNLLDAAKEEEQECFDNLPEGLQQSERGQQMEENVSTLESAVDALDEAVSGLDEI